VLWSGVPCSLGTSMLALGIETRQLRHCIARLLFNAPRQTGTHKGTSQRSNTITFLLFPFLPFSLASIKGRGGKPSQGLTNRILILRDLGSTPSPDQFVTPTTNNPSTGTRQLDTRRRVLLLGGPNQYTRCLLR
jgi:hypothetical protein